MQRRQTTTLKEKLNDHYAKRNFVVAEKKTASQAGVTFAITMMVSLAIEGVLVLIPSYYVDNSGQHTSWFFIGEVIVVWLFMEAMGNWWLTYFDISNRVTKETKDLHFPNDLDTPTGWKNCLTCMIDAPPRSHHCTLCNHCILKRDHHCFFTGSCVGYHNQRNFITFCVYAIMACGSAVFMQIVYLNQQVPFFTGDAVFYIPMVALWQLFTGVAHMLDVFILLHLYLTVFSLAVASFFLVWEMLVVARGQTSYEAWKDISIYRQQSLCSNFYSVFGNVLNTFVCFLIPIRTASPGDGIKWVISAKSQKGH